MNKVIEKFEIITTKIIFHIIIPFLSNFFNNNNMKFSTLHVFEYMNNRYFY